MAGCCNHTARFDGVSKEYKRRLWAVIVINAAMFCVEMAAGSEGFLCESSNGEEDDHIAVSPQSSLCQDPLSSSPTSFFRNLLNFQPAEII